MKKKIKDITLQEAHRICGQEFNCSYCPANSNNGDCMLNFARGKYLTDEHEIEVEE